METDSIAKGEMTIGMVHQQTLKTGEEEVEVVDTAAAEVDEDGNMIEGLDVLTWIPKRKKWLAKVVATFG